MVTLLRRLFSRGSRSSETRTQPTVEYKGYTITPTPEKDAGGWRVAGTISKEIDGKRNAHQFVRADVFPDREAVVAMTIEKAKRVIDEQRDRLFRDG